MRVESSASAFGLHGTATQYADLQTGVLRNRQTCRRSPRLDGYDGSVAWSGDGSHLVWNDGGDSDRASEINQAYLFSYALWKPQAAAPTVTWLGTKTEAVATYDALSIVPVGSKVPFELWFDRSTHLPARAQLRHRFHDFDAYVLGLSRVNGLNYRLRESAPIRATATTRRRMVTSVVFDARRTRDSRSRRGRKRKPTDFSIRRTERRRRPFRSRSAKITSTST